MKLVSIRLSVLTIGILLFLIGIVVLFVFLHPKTIQPRYNLILISVDTLRPDHMGIYGYSKDTTPHIDSLAKESFIFTDVHTTVPATYPSFVSLFTGMSPFVSDIYNNATSLPDILGRRVIKGNRKLPDNTTTLAQILHKNGYVTAGFINNIVLDSNLTGLNKGFEEYVVLSDQTKKIENDVSIAGKAINWLDKSETKNRPFFLWMHLLGPHAPYFSPDEFTCKFGEEYCQEIKQKGLVTLEKERQPLGVCLDAEEAKRRLGLFETLYDGGVGYADSLVGRVLDEIKKRGLEKNSIIVFYGDHGEGSDHAYFYNHGYTLYESSLKIPLIISIPGSEQNGRRLSYSINNSEIFSTLLNLLNVSLDMKTNIEPGFDSVFSGKEPQNSGKVETESYFMNVVQSSFAIREKNYKYIHSPSGRCFSEPEELYNLSNDPEEKINIIKDNPLLAAKLKEKLFVHVNRYLQSQTSHKMDSSHPKSSEEILKQLRSLGY